MLDPNDPVVQTLRSEMDEIAAMCQNTIEAMIQGNTKVFREIAIRFHELEKRLAALESHPTSQTETPPDAEGKEL